MFAVVHHLARVAGIFHYRARLLHVDAETYVTWHSGLGHGVIMKEDSDLSGLAKI